MKEIPVPERIAYPLAANQPDGCYSMQLKLLKKVNEIVGWINALRTVAEMSSEEIGKLGEYIQKLDKIEWKNVQKGEIMKVKIFEFETSKKTELGINEWLKNNPTAKIKFVTHGEAVGGLHYVTISIWYEK